MVRERERERETNQNGQTDRQTDGHTNTSARCRWNPDGTTDSYLAITSDSERTVARWREGTREGSREGGEGGNTHSYLCDIHDVSV